MFWQVITKEQFQILHDSKKAENKGFVNTSIQVFETAGFNSPKLETRTYSARDHIFGRVEVIGDTDYVYYKWIVK